MKINRTTVAVLLLTLASIATSTKGQSSGAVALQTKYDRFEDRTTVWTRFLILRVRNQSSILNELRLAAYFTYRGRAASNTVESFGLIFDSASRDWVYLKNSTLIALVDGTPFNLGRPIWRDSDVKSDGSEVKLSERVSFTVAFPFLKRIAHANTVEMRLGPSEVEPGELFIQGVRNLLAQVDEDKGRGRRAPTILKARPVLGPLPSVTVSYDKSENATSVVLWRMPVVVTAGPDGVSLSLVSVYEGQTVKALPSSVLLTVSGVEVASRKLEPEPDLILLIDGKRESFSAKWGNDVINNRAEADLHLPYAAIAKLASAQRVDGQAGITKFFLTVENRRAMRDFLSRLKPERKTP